MNPTIDLSLLSFSPDPDRLAEQVEVARQIAEEFKTHPVVLLDAPTGNGKSLIAELVRQVMDTRMLYTTSDKSLQRQFCDSFPESQLLMGRGNYPTLDYPDLFPELSASECDLVEKECSWCSVTDDCHYRVAKSALSKSSSVVTNTSYLLAESQIYHSACVYHFNDQLLVIDEADRLSGEVMSGAEVRISPSRKRSLKLPDVKKVTVVESWVEWCNRAIPIVKRAYEAIGKTVDPVKLRRKNGLRDLLNNLKTLLPDLTNGNWILCDYANGGITFKPVLVNDIAPKTLGYYRRVLLMSATIISPEEMTESLGITDYSVVRMGAKIPPSARPIIISPAVEMSYKNKESAYPIMVDAVRKIMDGHPNERGLIHTQSFHLAAAISAIDSDRIRHYTDSVSKVELFKWYESRPDAVLVAASMQRGYDGKDDLVRWQVIAKIPFPSLGDKQVSARLHSKGGSLWYRIETLRTIVQASGRGARHEDDYAITYILDSSMLRLWKENRQLLPAWWKDAVKLEPFKVLERRLQERESVQ